MKRIDSIVAKYSTLDCFKMGNGVSDNHIKEAELRLGIEFSPQYKYFLKKYGFIYGFGYELIGLFPDEFKKSDIVERTLDLRQEEGFDKLWIPFQKIATGENISFDYSRVNTNGEPKIFVHLFTARREDLAEDFVSYLEGYYEVAVKALEE